MLARLIKCFAVLSILALSAATLPAEAHADEMWVSCYGDCGTGYNVLYGNPTCADANYFFTGEDYTAAAIPMYPAGSILSITNADPYDDDYGYSTTVLVNDCYYGYSRWDMSSAAFGAIQDYSAGVAWVDVQVLRWGY